MLAILKSWVKKKLGCLTKKNNSIFFQQIFLIKFFLSNFSYHIFFSIKFFLSIFPINFPSHKFNGVHLQVNVFIVLYENKKKHKIIKAIKKNQE